MSRGTWRGDRTTACLDNLVTFLPKERKGSHLPSWYLEWEQIKNSVVCPRRRFWQELKALSWSASLTGQQSHGEVPADESNVKCSCGGSKKHLQIPLSLWLLKSLPENQMQEQLSLRLSSTQISTQIWTSQQIWRRLPKVHKTKDCHGHWVIVVQKGKRIKTHRTKSEKIVRARLMAVFTKKNH